MNHYFFSDVHLYPVGKFHPGREQLYRFLGELAEKEPGNLWILGDLFDFWFEYKTVIPAGYSHILSLIETLSSSGWQVFFLPGNHDWWCGDRLMAETGLKIIYDTVHTEVIDGRKTIMSHGDGLGKGDTGYKMIKPLLRSRAAKTLFSALHPTVATSLANLFSRTSKRILRKQVDSIPDYLTSWVLSQAELDDIELVITAHTHCPIVTHHEKVIHVSLGDWISHFTYLRIGGGEISLYEYK